MVFLLIVSHSYGNMNLAECAISDTHLVCFSHVQKNVFRPFFVYKCGLSLLLIFSHLLLHLFRFFFSVEDEKVRFFVN